MDLGSLETWGYLAVAFFAFGGSCLPKDLRALMYDAKTNDIECPVLGEVLHSNQKQIQAGIKMIEKFAVRR